MAELEELDSPTVVRRNVDVFKHLKRSNEAAHKRLIKEQSKNTKGVKQKAVTNVAAAKVSRSVPSAVLTESNSDEDGPAKKPITRKRTSALGGNAPSETKKNPPSKYSRAEELGKLGVVGLSNMRAKKEPYRSRIRKMLSSSSSSTSITSESTSSTISGNSSVDDLYRQLIDQISDKDPKMFLKGPMKSGSTSSTKTPVRTTHHQPNNDMVSAAPKLTKKSANINMTNIALNDETKRKMEDQIKIAIDEVRLNTKKSKESEPSPTLSDTAKKLREKLKDLVDERKKHDEIIERRSAVERLSTPKEQKTDVEMARRALAKVKLQEGGSGRSLLSQTPVQRRSLRGEESMRVHDLRGQTPFHGRGLPELVPTPRPTNPKVSSVSATARTSSHVKTRTPTTIPHTVVANSKTLKYSQLKKQPDITKTT